MLTPQDRFKRYVEIAESGCHEWTSTLHRDGYGKFYFRGKQMQSHRAVWILFVGEIPKGMCVLHKCDNRKCVNVEHLYVGTHSDNVRDKVERHKGMWGRMKVPFETVQEARRLYAETGMSQQAIADQLGLCQTQVSRYVLKRQRLSK